MELKTFLLWISLQLIILGAVIGDANARKINGTLDCTPIHESVFVSVALGMIFPIAFLYPKQDLCPK